MTSWEMVSAVYGPLPAMVRVSAQANVLHHLDKMEREGRITRRFPDLWALVPRGAATAASTRL
jgi:hypothetical protein